MIDIDITGIEGVQEMLQRMPEELAEAFRRGASESAQEILQTTGLQQYPAETAANSPPTPYWVRTRGMQRGGTRIPEYNDAKSEKLGEQFYTEERGDWEVAIGNRASYAPFVVGLQQAGALAAIGWRRLQDVAEDKRSTIERIVTQWIERAVDKANR